MQEKIILIVCCILARQQIFHQIPLAMKYCFKIKLTYEENKYQHNSAMLSLQPFCQKSKPVLFCLLRDKLAIFFNQRQTISVECRIYLHFHAIWEQYVCHQFCRRMEMSFCFSLSSLSHCLSTEPKEFLQLENCRFCKLSRIISVKYCKRLKLLLMHFTESVFWNSFILVWASLTHADQLLSYILSLSGFHRGSDILAMTHNHFCLLCFLLSQCKERYFWHFLPTDLNMLGFYFPLFVHSI